MLKRKPPLRCLLLCQSQRTDVLFGNKHYTFSLQTLSQVLARLCKARFRKVRISIGLPESVCHRRWQQFDKDISAAHRYQFACHHAQQFFGHSAEELNIDYTTIVTDTQDQVSYVALTRERFRYLYQACRSYGYRLERLVPMGDLIATGLQALKLDQATLLIITEKEITYLHCAHQQVRACETQAVLSENQQDYIFSARYLWQRFVAHEALKNCNKVWVVDFIALNISMLALPVPVEHLSQADFFRCVKVGLSLCQ